MKLIEENEENVRMINELREKCIQYEEDLDKANENNMKLIENNHLLEKVIGNITTFMNLYFKI